MDLHRTRAHLKYRILSIEDALILNVVFFILSAVLS